MKLYHVSEEPDITIFNPRIPRRTELNQSKGLVWAVNEECLVNFLTPRDCPRVTFYADGLSSKEDCVRFFSSDTMKHVIVIEQDWFRRMIDTTLYLYEFDPSGFYLQDQCAGYYVSESSQVPMNKIIVTDLFGELFKRNAELRIVDYLWNLRDEIVSSTLRYSLCRMANAKEKI